jgi:hypothetical protein
MFLGLVLIFVMTSILRISTSSPLLFTPHGWSTVVECSFYQLWIRCYALCYKSSVFHASALYPPQYITIMAKAVDLSLCILCSWSWVSDMVGCKKWPQRIKLSGTNYKHHFEKKIPKCFKTILTFRLVRNLAKTGPKGAHGPPLDLFWAQQIFFVTTTGKQEVYLTPPLSGAAVPCSGTYYSAQNLDEIDL